MAGRFIGKNSKKKEKTDSESRQRNLQNRSECAVDCSVFQIFSSPVATPVHVIASSQNRTACDGALLQPLFK